MATPISYRKTWSLLWHRCANRWARVAASVGAAGVLGGMALGNAWVYMARHGVQRVTWTGGTLLRVDLDREATTIALVVAGALWGVLIWRIWGRKAGEWRGAEVDASEVAAGNFRTWVFILTGTALLLLAFWVGVSLVARSGLVPGDRRILLTAIDLFCGGSLLLIWLPVMSGPEGSGRPVLGADGLVNVRCPGCGYNLIGLRELRCPECGITFTIDELIKAQRYEQPESAGRADLPVDLTDDHTTPSSRGGSSA